MQVRARFTKQGILASDRNPIKVPMGVESSTDNAQIKEHRRSQIISMMTNTIHQEQSKKTTTTRRDGDNQVCNLLTTQALNRLRHAFLGVK